MPKLLTADLVSPAIPTHHDSDRLADAVIGLVKDGAVEGRATASAA
jgi:hypothetical protein